MTAFCFIGGAVLIFVLHVISAFIAWDLAPLNLVWSNVLAWMRVTLVLSAFFGVLFTFSEQGLEFAKEFAEEYVNVKNKTDR
jgi:cytochrome c biogenesis protein CcdA